MSPAAHLGTTRVARFTAERDGIFAHCQLKSECTTYLINQTLFHSKLYCEMKPNFRIQIMN